jgi:hypothetical protein
MDVAKLEIKVGAVSFSGEGGENWLAIQLDKVLAKLPELLAVNVGNDDESLSGNGGVEKPRDATKVDAREMLGLAAYLKAKKATGNQARKFLATGLWLHDSKDLNRIATADVTKALNEHNQGKLPNAAQCLINNITQGRIVRDGKQFYVTDDGRAELDK